VKSFFTNGDQVINHNRIQNRLMTFSRLAIFTYALILTVSPAVRFHGGFERYKFQHWIGVIVWFLSFSVLQRQTNLKLSESDPYLLPIISLLSGIGLLTIWRLFPNLGLRQTIWLLIGSLIIFIGLFLPNFLQYLRRYKYIWLVFGLILTGLTIFLGTNPLGDGATRWLNLFGMRFQPSEPLKLLLIAYLAGYFTDRITLYKKGFEAIFPTLIITTIALILLVFQGDIGTASIFLVIYLAILFTSGGNRWVLWISPVLIIIAGIAGYFFIDIVRLRLDAWLNPFNDPTGISYQVIQSMVAIAEGNLFGTGLGLGSPGLIPVSVSDFIFSALGEEIGLLGISVIIILFIFLIYRSLIIAITTNNTFHRNLALGLTFYFGTQTILIIGGNIGFLPLTGVTLPFLSYGGSSLLVSFFGVLILLTISHQSMPNKEPKALNFPRYALVGSMLIIVLIIEILISSMLAFWLSTALVNRPENPRWIIDERFVERGNIVDRDNQIISTNIGQVGNFQRTNLHTPLYPIIGYVNPIYGQTGIESSMFNYLRGKSGYPFKTQYWQKLLYNQPPEGLDVRLTIDLELQKTADSLLAEYPGAIIVMNANSGEILTMASHPYFNAESLQENWDDLLADEKAPFLNRVTQGLYPPGAALFPFIILDDPDIFGQKQEPPDRIGEGITNPNCARLPEEPTTWKSLISNGCQGIQKIIATEIGSENLLDLYANLGFFASPQLHLAVGDAISPDFIGQDGFFLGEGPFKISPLQMALAVSAISNQGVLPGPRIVNAYNDPIEGWVTLPKLQPNSQAIDPLSAGQVNDLLKQTNYPYWQVISIVKSEEQEDITWFIASTSVDWQGQPITTVVVLEINDPDSAESIGRTLLEQAIRFHESDL